MFYKGDGASIDVCDSLEFFALKTKAVHHINSTQLAKSAFNI